MWKTSQVRVKILLRKADRYAGMGLRKCFDLVTGNYFVHQEKRIMAAIADMQAAIELSLGPVRRLHDERQKALLDKFRPDE